MPRSAAPFLAAALLFSRQVHGACGHDQLRALKPLQGQIQACSEIADTAQKDNCARDVSARLRSALAAENIRLECHREISDIESRLQLILDAAAVRLDAENLRDSLHQIDLILGKPELKTADQAQLNRLFEKARSAGGDSFGEVFEGSAPGSKRRNISARHSAAAESQDGGIVEAGLRVRDIPEPEVPDNQADMRCQVARFSRRVFPQEAGASYDIPPAHKAYLRSLADPIYRTENTTTGTLVFHAEKRLTEDFQSKTGRLPSDPEFRRIHEKVWGKEGSTLRRLMETCVRAEAASQQRQQQTVVAIMASYIPGPGGLIQYYARPPETTGEKVIMIVQVVGTSVLPAAKFTSPFIQIGGYFTSWAASWVRRIMLFEDVFAGAPAYSRSFAADPCARR